MEIDGVPHKIRRIPVEQINKKTLDKIRTQDTSLLDLLNRILNGKDDKYTVEKYLKENDLKYLSTPGGQIIRKISVDDGPVTNYYRKDIAEGNYTHLGMLKYYCIELYRDADGNLQTYGVRFVDIVKKNGKLYRKAESLPSDYDKHEMYIFKGDYIRITTPKGNVKFEGYYYSVKSIIESRFYVKSPNIMDAILTTISKKDDVKKLYVDILGNVKGEIKCSEPLQYIKVKESQ